MRENLEILGCSAKELERKIQIICKNWKLAGFTVSVIIECLSDKEVSRELN